MPQPTDHPPVHDATDDARFEVRVDGVLAYLTYRRSAEELRLLRTEVPDEIGGRGVGSHLVRHAAEQASAGGLAVVADCPFARTYLERHPVAGGADG
jgi:uncharacterized protein